MNRAVCQTQRLGYTGIHEEVMMRVLAGAWEPPRRQGGHGIPETDLIFSNWMEANLLILILISPKRLTCCLRFFQSHTIQEDASVGRWRVFRSTLGKHMAPL